MGVKTGGTPDRLATIEEVGTMTAAEPAKQVWGNSTAEVIAIAPSGIGKCAGNRQKLPEGRLPGEGSA